MRQLIIDTETSGLDFDKDRIIEIGCLELIDGVFTGNKFHQYYKPDEIEISSESERIHGLSNKFLSKFIKTLQDFIKKLKYHFQNVLKSSCHSHQNLSRQSVNSVKTRKKKANFISLHFDQNTIENRIFEMKNGAKALKMASLGNPLL